MNVKSFPIISDFQNNALADRKRVMVLASGDPLFYGVGRRLLKRLGSERLMVLPNISAVQALFARIPECWEDVAVFSLHGRSHNLWLQELRAGRKVAILTDPRHSPDWIARELARAGVRNCSLVVGENLGGADEQVLVLTVDEAATMVFAPLRRGSGPARQRRFAGVGASGSQG